MTTTKTKIQNNKRHRERDHGLRPCALRAGLPADAYAASGSAGTRCTVQFSQDIYRET